MYGAILGDMIGAPYEFDLGDKTKTFPLFCTASRYTDDTVMTIAVAEALLETRGLDDDAVRAAVVKALRKWGRKYPRAGYGERFAHWLTAEHPEPYGSYGNGSAMRVSAAGWLFDTLEETVRAAGLSAEVTHDHPEGIKGAQATAAAIFLARTGCGKDGIRAHITKEYGYDLSRSCDEIRPTYHHVESCQETVPEAIAAFLDGTDFEDVIRTAVSLGGDCDTLTCIAGGIAEAFYGVPTELKQECRIRLPDDMLSVLDRFDEARKDEAEPLPDEVRRGNAPVVSAVARACRSGSLDDVAAVLNAIRLRMRAGGLFLVPAAVSADGRSQTLQRIRSGDGERYLVCFSSWAEYEKGRSAPVASLSVEELLKTAAGLDTAGILLDPWGPSFPLTKELIALILKA